MERKARNARKALARVLPEGIVKLLARVGTKAVGAGAGAYAVGGMVRDAILNRKNIDLDIVITGDAVSLGRTLAKDLRGSVVAHNRFKTAAVVFEREKKRYKIDLATARKEYYARPAALPEVSRGTLRDDCARRDFTINAMAVDLNPGRFGRLIDHCGGMDDIRRGTVRVMHDRSFSDDPTRIFRAVRFEQRYGFSIERHTGTLMKRAIRSGAIARTSKDRIRNELVLILKEDDPFRALARLEKLGALKYIDTSIGIGGGSRRLFREIKKICAWFRRLRSYGEEPNEWLVYFMGLMGCLPSGVVARICGSAALKRSDALKVTSYALHAARIMRTLGRSKNIPASAVYRMLEPVSTDGALAIYSRSRSAAARRRVREYLRKGKNTRLSIGGRDLKKLGLEPGPGYKKVLDQILDRKLDGAIASAGQEMKTAGDIIRKRRIGRQENGPRQ
ncbi:MAG: hypothetical protein ABIJ27_08555 [Candidatus Omnitrophota bacterium]